jgi:predicted aminopeptidase
MDIYRRSRLSEQELEALELREREVNVPLGGISAFSSLGFFGFYFLSLSLAVLCQLALNSWAQVILLPQPSQ